MPLIYDVRCEACGNGYSICEFYLAVQLDDGSLKPLRHPLEENDLTDAGFTFPQARREARLVRCESGVCKHCGGLYERRTFEPPLGCLGGIMAAVQVALLLSALIWMAFPGGHSPGSRTATKAVVAGVLAAGALWLVRRWEKRGWRRHLAYRPPLTDERCCASATPDSIIALDSIKLPRVAVSCAACGGRATATICIGGIS